MNDFVDQMTEAGRWVRDSWNRLSVRRDTGPINDSELLADFVTTRAALVTQKKLYGYLKERIGMRYPKMFADEEFSRSINIAKMQVFAASLADLTIHCVAHVGTDQRLEQGDFNALAVWCYGQGVAANEEQAPNAVTVSRWLSEFGARADKANWHNIAAGASAFTESPKALIRWAPIADEHKNYDREIVENSMRFAWNEVRTEFRERLDAAAVSSDWKSRSKPD
ncbi:hypothetical protein GA830_14465 [Mesorhizobium sp. NBSH29]|nr:hypothetical protein GA830_14465 [Mesorhizobium sp. NBSH29]